MGLIRRTPTAVRDIREIWFYVAESADEASADRLVRGFDTKLRLLSEIPGVGKARNDLRPRLSSFPVGKYMLYYRPIRGGIELVPVLHGARDIESEFHRT